MTNVYLLLPVCVVYVFAYVVNVNRSYTYHRSIEIIQQRMDFHAITGCTYYIAGLRITL